MSIYGSTFTLIYSIVMSAVLGAIMGSGINCLAWRIVHHESWLKGKSHCAECGHELAMVDLIPVFSYLFLGGKCRYCHKKISPRYMLVELCMAILFVGIILHYGELNFSVLRDMGLTCLLVGLSLVDLDIYEIPDGFVIAGIIWWLLFTLIDPARWDLMKQGVISGLVIAGSMLVLSLIMDRILKKESMGGGDIKLFFMVCLYLPLLESLFCLILSCIIGLVFVLLLKNDKIPFGPAISLSAYITLIIGTGVVSWYLSLF